MAQDTEGDRREEPKAPLIDFHSHFTPRELVEERLSSKAQHEVEMYEGLPVFTHNRQLFDLQYRLESMDMAGVASTYLSSSAGFNKGSLDTCKLVNDALAEVSQQHPGRLRGLAHAPLYGDDRSLEEIERACRDLGFHGVAIMASTDGRWIDDPELEELFSLIEELGAFLFVHAPISPSIGNKPFDRYDLFRTVGREFELQLAVLRLILGGVMDRHPRLNVVVGHLGGGIAAVWPRVRLYQNKSFWGVEGDPEHGLTANKPIDEYFDRIFFDTAGFFGDSASTRAALVQIPPSQIVFGSDYPQQLGEGQRIKSFVQEIEVLERDIGQGLLSNGPRRAY